MPTKGKITVKPRGKPFPKGVSGNPNGAPIMESRISTWIEKALDRIVPESLDRVQYENQVSMREYIADRLVLQAASHPENDLPYIKEVLDRTEGKPQQKVDHTTLGEKIIPILGGIVQEPEE